MAPRKGFALIAEIYHHYILNSVAAFDEEIVLAREIQTRMDAEAPLAGGRGKWKTSRLLPGGAVAISLSGIGSEFRTTGTLSLL